MYARASCNASAIDDVPCVGRIDLIAEYCAQDVEVTHGVYAYGMEHGYILYKHRSGMNVRVPVDW